MLRRTMADRAAQQRVLGQVDRADLVGLASALIRIPSFKTEETPVAAIATLPGTGGGASLMLNGHADINGQRQERRCR
jgi:hypothetical protein